MAFLNGISDRFWNFVSPRKTQQRRDKTFKAPAAPNKAQIQTRIKELNAHQLTPDSRIRTWTVGTPDSNMSVENVDLPPSPPTSAPRSPSDYEGETFVADEAAEFGDDEGWDANEDTILVDDGQYMDQQGKFDPEEERLRREKQGRELRDAGWSEDAIFLFQKLGMRGFEPVMPMEWYDDFDSLPADLFTSNPDKAFIKPTLGSDYHAQLALRKLFELGPLARDAVLTQAPIRTPEHHIRRAVMNYHEWALKDGDVKMIGEELPLFKTVTCSKDIPASFAEEKMLRKLSKLHTLWSDALHLGALEEGGRSQSESPQVPTLYGVIASHTIMAFVSYVPPKGNDSPVLHTVAIFNFREEGYDVWNSLAVAIFAIHCRNRMVQLKEYLPEVEPVVIDDPDL